MKRYAVDGLERTYVSIDSDDSDELFAQIRRYGMLDGTMSDKGAPPGKERDFIVELGENRDGRRMAEFSTFDTDIETGDKKQVYAMISGFYPTKETSFDELLRSTNYYLIDEIGERLPQHYELPNVRLNLKILEEDGPNVRVNLEAIVEGTANISKLLEKMNINALDGVTFGERARAYWQALFGIYALEYAVKCQAQVCGKTTKEEALHIFLIDKLKSGIRNAFTIMINNLEDDLQEYMVITDGPQELIGRLWKNPLKTIFFSPSITPELEQMRYKILLGQERAVSKDFMLPGIFRTAPRDREKYKVIVM